MRPVSETELGEMLEFVSRNDFGPGDWARLQEIRQRATEALEALGVAVGPYGVVVDDDADDD